jgi:hypothetical protein
MRALFLMTITLGLLTASAQAGSLEAYTAVIGGSNTLCAGGGGPVPAIYSYFPSAGDFGLLTPNPGGDSIGGCGLSGSISDITGSTVPVSSSTTLPTTPYSSYPTNSVSGSSSATAGYGSVSIATSTTLTGVQGPNGEGESAAFAIASDNLSVSCSPSCTSGFMAFDFTLTGSVSILPASSGGGVMEVDAEIGGNPNESLFYGNVQGSSASAAGIANVDGTPTEGQPIAGCVTGAGSFICTNATLETTLMPVSFASGLAFSFGVVGETSLGIDQTITVDPPSMTLTGIQVYDASGNQVTSFTITGDSGSIYGADGFESGPGSTPEPATFLLLLTGLISLVAAHRRFLQPARIRKTDSI